MMANPVSWAFRQVKKWNDAIWHTPLSELSRRKSFFIKQLRIIVVATRGFLNDKIQLRASALTLYTLLSIIPVVAILLAIGKGFGLDQNLEAMITRSKEFLQYSDILNPLLDKAKSTVEATEGGYIAGVGVVILFWAVISLLGQIETSFNHVWQISIARPWYRKFTDYLTIILIAPIFLVISSSVTVYVNSDKMIAFMEQAPIIAIFKPVISLLMKFVPYLLVWIVLTLLFMVMPHTKVKFFPALVSGIIAGTALKLLQWLYFDLQFGISKLNLIYGTLAAFPLFIIFIQASWLVILLGAELSFANQNASRYEFESEALNISHFQKRALSLMIMHMIIRNFSVGEKPISAETISKTLKIPVRLVRDILQDLSNSHLISEIHEHEQKEGLFQPALDISKLSVTFVLGRLEKRGTDHKVVIRNNEYERVVSVLEKFDKLAAKSDSNILIKDL
jgi:membrane protein